MDLEDLAPEVVPGVRVLPVVHDRLDLAAIVRITLERLKPQAVAVELPPTFESFALQAVNRLPRLSLLISREKNEEALVWVVAPGDPFVEALRWATERELPTFFIDPDLRYRERHVDAVPDPYALFGLGPAAYLNAVLESAERRGPTRADRERESGMAFYVQTARRAVDNGTLLVLVGASHFRGLAEKLRGPTAEPLARRRRQSIELRHIHPESLTGLLPDPPLAHAVFEALRHGEPKAPPLEAVLSRKISLTRHGLRLITREKTQHRAERRRSLVDYAAARAVLDLGGRGVLDRLALGTVVWQIGAGSYTEQTRETIQAWQRRLFFDFARRYARAQGLLVPGLYEWVVAGRGVADDNLAWEIFDAARTYPWQTEQAEIPLVRVEGSELDLGTRKVRFRRRFFRVKQRWVPVPVRRRQEAEDPEKWIRAFEGRGICSYPPEDLVVEDYGRFLQQKAVGLLSAERRRVEPFSTSLLDGIDIRETLLKLHEGRIYVQELGRAPGKAGSVVVIFDPDRGPESKYPYRMTWHGEHGQESDMAFYATEPTEQIVGPGIMRATYGGFMMTLPPGRLYDVWGDPDYRLAREKAEVLLMAAVDYSLEKIVVHVGKAAPPDRLRQYAGGQGKRIVHIPMGSLSVAALKKIRTLHILAGHDKRAIARDYIW
jgi:hypothetical protein